MKIWIQQTGGRATKAAWRDVGDVRDLKLTLPLPLRDRWPTPRIVQRSRGKPDDSFALGPTTMVSQRLVGLLEKYGGLHYEALPVVLESGSEELRYYFLHILEHHDVLDREQAVFTLARNGKVDEITKIAFLECAKEVSELYWLDAYEPVLLVSDALSVHLSSASGVTFVEPEAWRPY